MVAPVVPGVPALHRFLNRNAWNLCRFQLEPNFGTLEPVEPLEPTRIEVVQRRRLTAQLLTVYDKRLCLSGLRAEGRLVSAA
jgi:hypothetical protein